MNRKTTTLGIFYLIAGISVFSVQDLILKLISGGYPLYQAMLIRGFTSIPFLLAFAHFDGGLRTLFSAGVSKMLLRGLVMFIAYFSFYIALAGLPLPTTVALFYSGPLFITLLSVLFLGERVSVTAWAAVVLGFIGVVIMVRPGSDLFDWAAILPILSGLTYAISMITARKMGGTETAAALAFWSTIVFLSGAGLMALYYHDGSHTNTSHASLAFLTRGWITPTPRDLALMMTCGVVAAMGLWLLTQAYRIAAASTVAPFEYLGLIWSVLWGWLFWRDWPDAQGWLGIGIIAGAGLFVLLQESRRSAQSPKAVV
ncbi:DMT family transporter [Cypionkella sp.]|uniref:DMT family transporter n=1 Tax=Cypionkella sp. TaxID=2811411 RepID=UPI002613DE2F|nr:DMT family transporter [Cypionkella sp.]MDB5665310.1 EamA/RhaT family transporter [Cypionkella sp.]